MNEIKVVRELARDALSLADRKCWGLGEVRFNINCNALDALMDEKGFEDCMGNVNFDDFGCDCAEPMRTVHMRAARKLAGKAYELACELQDKGVTTFN